jgi:hypothetical protein
MIHALHQFETVSEFLQFTKQLEEMKWRIGKMLLKERVIKHAKNELFTSLKKTYIQKEMSFFELKDEEVITWMDTLLLLRRTLIELYNRGTLKEELVTIMEYPFVFGNFMRSDYLLVFERTIIVVEFGMFNQDEKRKEERYTKKIQENIGHRHILANMLSKDINIYTYVFMYRPEFDDFFEQEMLVNRKHNIEMVKQFAHFLEHKIKAENQHKVIYQLQQLEQFRK